jgi:catechol 2,3-dioxygenase-like lactoylglutathione lyase family enzyme
MQFAHIGFSTRDLQKSKEFYIAALRPLGLSLGRESEDSLHFSQNGDRTLLWIHTRSDVTTPLHISFEADSRAQVDEFYRAATAAGGKDNGAPGIRENYSPNYYAAFVIDPDGHNLEVVYRGQ